MTKVLWFWLFSVLSHQSWVKKNFLFCRWTGHSILWSFEVPWLRLVCTSVEFVFSIVIKSVVIYSHLYERRVCSFDRNQMVQILILCFTLNGLSSFSVFGWSLNFKFKFAGGNCSLHMYKFHISFMRDQAGHWQLWTWFWCLWSDVLHVASI